jgi:hypothetical protein
MYWVMALAGSRAIAGDASRRALRKTRAVTRAVGFTIGFLEWRTD